MNAGYLKTIKKLDTVEINPNWKEIVRRYFSDPKTKAEFGIEGNEKFPLFEVKREIYHAKMRPVNLENTPPKFY